MGSFLDAFGDGVSVHDGGMSRPSHKRHRSRSRVSHRHKSGKRSGSSSSSGGRARRSTNRASASTSALGAGLSYLLDDGGHHESSSKRYAKNSASRGSLLDTLGQGLGLGGDDHHRSSGKLGHHHNASRSSFFGFGGSSGHRDRSGSSYYKRSSRQGFLQRAYRRLKKLLRDLARWAKRHPWKVFFMVIMPLVTGGALTALLARFGLRIPRSLERLVDAASKAYMGNPAGAFGDAVRIAGEFSSGGAAGAAAAAAAGAGASRAAPRGGPGYPGAGSIGGTIRRDYYSTPPAAGPYGSGPYGYKRDTYTYNDGLAYGNSSLRNTYDGSPGAWESAANGIAKLFI